MGEEKDATKGIRRAVATFCILSGSNATLLRQKEIQPEDYDEQHLRDLLRTIREERQSAGEDISQYAEWLDRCCAHFRRGMNAGGVSRRLAEIFLRRGNLMINARHRCRTSATDEGRQSSIYCLIPTTLTHSYSK